MGVASRKRRRLARRFGLAVGAVTLVAVGVPGTGAAAFIPAEGLITPTTAPRDAVVQQWPLDATPVRTAYVHIDAAALRAALSATPTTVSLPLFSDTTVTLEGAPLDAPEHPALAGRPQVAWAGTPGDAGFASLTIVGESVVGAIDDGSQRYEIAPIAAGVHAITQFDAGALRLYEGPDRPAPALPMAEDEPEPPEIALPPTDEADIGGAGAPNIDVLVAYTQAADAAVTDVEATIARMVNDANTAYSRSGVSQRIRLIATQQVSYTEGTDNTDLARLQGTSDGFLDGLHNTRNAVGADVVALVGEHWNASRQSCGLGYVMTTVGSGFAPWAFSLNDVTCSSVFVLAHEFGHNMGLDHDWPNDDAPGANSYPYAHGFVSREGDFRTVMAYDDPACPGGSCPLVLNFSNPNVLVNGFPSGRAENVSNPAFNAKALNNTDSTVSKFRAFAQHRWLLNQNNAGGGVAASFYWGPADGIPLAGDWDGDGVWSPGVAVQSATGGWTWHLRTNNDPNDPSYYVAPFGWGAGTKTPVVGDWDGNCSFTPGFSYPSGSGRTWQLSNHNSGGGVDYQFAWGADTTKPVVGDWDGPALGDLDGCGTFTPGVTSSSGSGLTWKLRNTNSGGGIDLQFGWGAPTDQPVAGNWDGASDLVNGANATTVGVVRRPSSGGLSWKLRNINSGGGVDVSFGWGASTDTPIVGDWDGNGTVTPGVIR